jgi:predicted RNase H-like nuclease (RuvC/YqgF family)
MNNEIFIPSNFTLDDVIQYVKIPEEVRTLLETASRRINHLETEVRKIEKHNDMYSEQLYFCREFIHAVKDEAEKATKVKELKKYIEVTLENSYIEL